MKLNYLTIFVAFLFFSLGPNIYSQEKGQLGLNSDFLDSLPDEVREDLLEEIEGNQSQLEEVDYGALSSLFKDPAAKYIEQELLRSEIPTIPPQEIPLEDLKFFGEEFFRGLPLSFMPISDPSLSSDYVVGVGDTLNVNIVGINNINEGIKVAKDGTLTISTSQLSDIPIVIFLRDPFSKPYSSSIKLLSIDHLLDTEGFIPCIFVGA